MAWRAASATRTERRFANSASSDTTSAPALFCVSVAKAASNSPSVPASSTTTSCPILRVASFNSRLAAVALRLFGLTRSAINGVGEISSRKRSRLLSSSATENTVTPVKLPRWSIEAGNEAGSNRIAASGNDDRHGRGCHPQCTDRNVGSTCKEDRHFAFDQFGRQFRQSIELAVCPAEFNRNVLAINVARFVQCPAERRHQVGIRSERATTQETDHRHRRLLRASHQRPRRRCAHSHQEVSSPHIAPEAQTLHRSNPHRCSERGEPAWPLWVRSGQKYRANAYFCDVQHCVARRTRLR